MFLNILKKDLKRKKTMNVILLVFIILATMFISSSVNNIISVTTALDDYLDMADAPDYLMITMNKIVLWILTKLQIQQMQLNAIQLKINYFCLLIILFLKIKI